MKRGKAISGKEFVKMVAKKAIERHEKYLEDSTCQNCGESEAEYPDGKNPYHCAECNAKTEEILKKLRGPGFMEIRR